MWLVLHLELILQLQQSLEELSQPRLHNITHHCHEVSLQPTKHGIGSNVEDHERMMFPTIINSLFILTTLLHIHIKYTILHHMDRIHSLKLTLFLVVDFIQKWQFEQKRLSGSLRESGYMLQLHFQLLHQSLRQSMTHILVSLLSSHERDII